MKELNALEQVSGLIRALQISILVLLTNIVININLKTLTILAKRLMLVACLGPVCVSVDGDITVLKIQMEICKDGRRVNIELF